MTLYLWHLTVMIILVGLAHYGGDIGLTSSPGSVAWWLSRLPWMVMLLTVMLLFIAVLGRFEQPRKHQSHPSLSTWRVVAGSVVLCSGLALLVTGGISDQGPVGLRWPAVLPTLVGLFLVRARWSIVR
jgi:hypothetical protein